MGTLEPLDWIHPREREHKAVYRAYLFGPFRVFRGDEALGQRSQRREKAQLLLKWFLLNQGQPRSIDELIELAFPAAAPDKAASSFHVAMHCLRRMLEPDLRPGEESSYIRRSSNNFYRFEADSEWWTDTAEVDRLFDQGRTSDSRGDAQRACFYYGQVVGHMNRRLLEDDSPQPWLTPYRRRYQALQREALLRLVQIHGERGQIDESLEYAHQMLIGDPYNELAVTTIVEADLAYGRLAHARHRISAFLDALTHDLGIAPSHGLLTLRARVRQDVPHPPRGEVQLELAATSSRAG
ncbi:BTAD domain-containing putative transcriptional regulator [Kribbella sp. NPDC056951]|uniref:AfsR/SARP family transcriptional regulator n=1 Tax=Kribbella sp. NPDC056951 TaxID=3345978 RepID=UPI00362F373D